MPREPVQIVTLSREYGAGGSQLGLLLGSALAWPVLDRDLAERLAKQLRCKSADVEEHHERAPRFLERIAAAFTVVPSDAPILPMADVETGCYLRLRALDRPGVLADVTRICADLDISIDAIFQKEAGEGEEQTDVVILTHRTLEKNVNAALRRIEALATIPAPVVRIRLEELL